MSEIQVIIPLAVLAGAKSLTPEGIVEFLQTAIDNKIHLDRAETRITVLQNVIRGIGGNLQGIWEDEDDNFKKAQKIRGLIAELKSFDVKGLSE